MEDASLDDFFAKKDKSKKKSKSSKLASGDILEKTDEPVKKEKKKKVKEKSQASTNNDSDSTIRRTEEEWKDVEEEEEKDYSGLRIANLQVTEKELEESEGPAVENEDEEDEEGKKRDSGQQGPWLKSDGTSQPHVAPKGPKPTEPVTDDAPKVEAKATPTGKYIPPSQRAAAAAAASGISMGPTIPAHLRKKKAAPNIKSEHDFPTLGGGVMPFHQDSDPRSFEQVQHGGRQADDATKTSQQLSLGNKFSALQD